MNRFVGLKKKNAALKAVLAIGGWNEGSVNYSNVKYEFLHIKQYTYLF